jgi:hypothetical protein
MLDSDLTADFPEYKREISILLEQDSDFKEVAEDFLFCKMELERLSLKPNKELIQQYSETLEDLKQELITRLQQN